MTRREPSMEDFVPPTGETLQDIEALIGEVNKFIEEDPRGHVEKHTGRDGDEEVHRYIVTGKMTDDKGEFDLNASIIERRDEPADVIISVKKDETSAYFERLEDDEPHLSFTGREPKTDGSGDVNLAAMLMGSINEAAEANRLGITDPTEKGMNKLADMTREVMRRISAAGGGAE